ncbi:hypothetical protein Y1Q_0006146 [Alligator mississippiensis]|uniref:Uncharacterized protein n=1 Tax=Alligator mississippiensis TaxID=8496 RepID=A0A151NWL0_ALLMI|nr:hypothetical protein Y1Q_0006146 [Alligator mississippiensis]
MDTKVLWYHLQKVKHWFWAHATSSHWRKKIILDTWDDEQWVQTFHMQTTFMDIVAYLAPHIACQDVSMSPPLNPENWVAITIMNLATPRSFLCITNQFRAGKSWLERPSGRCAW